MANHGGQGNRQRASRSACFSRRYRQSMASLGAHLRYDESWQRAEYSTIQSLRQIRCEAVLDGEFLPLLFLTTFL